MQAAAIDHPHRVASLVPCCCRARMVPEFATLWHGLIDTVKTKGFESIVEPTAQRWFSEEFKAANPGVLDGVRRMIRGTSEAGYLGCVGAFLGLDIEDRLGEIRAPTLYVSGAEDRLGGPPALMAGLAARVPGARHESVTGAATGAVDRITALCNGERYDLCVRIGDPVDEPSGARVGVDVLHDASDDTDTGQLGPAQDEAVQAVLANQRRCHRGIARTAPRCRLWPSHGFRFGRGRRCTPRMRPMEAAYPDVDDASPQSGAVVGKTVSTRDTGDLRQRFGAKEDASGVGVHNCCPGSALRRMGRSTGPADTAVRHAVEDISLPLAPVVDPGREHDFGHDALLLVGGLGLQQRLGRAVDEPGDILGVMDHDARRVLKPRLGRASGPVAHASGSHPEDL